MAWFNRPASKVAVLCVGFIGFYAATRLRSIAQVRSSRFILMCAVIATAGLLAWTWQYVTRRNWSWPGTFLAVAAALVAVARLLASAYGR